jgi:hypothetical protein
MIMSKWNHYMGDVPYRVLGSNGHEIAYVENYPDANTVFPVGGIVGFDSDEFLRTMDRWILVPNLDGEPHLIII